VPGKVMTDSVGARQEHDWHCWCQARSWLTVLVPDKNMSDSVDAR